MGRRVFGRPNRDRKRLRRCEPQFPPSAFVPASTCPHGVEIRAGWVCMVCHGASPEDSDAIARMPAPPPTEPERRILAEVAALRASLAKPGCIPPESRRVVALRLAELDRELKRWIATRYTRPHPNRKGGR